MVNPYASDSFNRIKVRSDPEEIKEREKVDHPLVEGKKLDMSRQEMGTFAKAMKDSEFQNIMSEYVDEISDPKHREEQDKYLYEMKEKGEMPPGSELIQPGAGFCIKTTAKRMVSDRKKTFFDQKAFVNICWHDSVDKPEQKEQVMPDGKKGNAWSLPYRVSKGKHDQDNKKRVCMTYDVVFNADVARFVHNQDFKKFVADTAIDGCNRIMAANKEKLSSDYKIMKHINCKGVRPQLMAIKSEIENKLLQNMDPALMETKLQKDILKQQADARRNEAREKEELQLKDGEVNLGEEEQDDDEEEKEEPRPTGIVMPKYRLVHSYPVDIADSWEGNTGTIEDQKMQKRKKLPTYLTVTINCTHVDSMKKAKLEINESNLVFEYPDLYYLDLNLRYKCDSTAGNAKFDKTKKTLTIKLPILGMTEVSQKVADADYERFLEAQKEQEERLAGLEASRLEEEADARSKRKHKVGEDDDDQENESGNIPEQAGEGISKSKFI